MKARNDGDFVVGRPEEKAVGKPPKSRAPNVLELRGKLLRMGRDPADLEIELLPEA